MNQECETALACAPDGVPMPDSAAGSVGEMETCAVLAVMPAFNEAASVASVVRDVLAQGVDVLVVDDASEDDTARAASEAGAMVIRHAVRLGAWGGTQTGLRFARRAGYGCVLSIDADGQHPVDAIPELLAPLRDGSADVVIGACTERGSTLRHVAWTLFRALSHLKVRDLTSGFRAYGPRAVKCLASRQATLVDYQDLGVLFLLAENGMRMQEMHVPMRPRKTGHSRIFNNWFAVADYMVYSFLHAVWKNRHISRIDRCKT
ncbi:hypothetical protein GGQ74_002422 [Desulfobaculum xiamenense]|uniref:Glycosyltransferase 2-like domain-containing protein n=1 Tax=Desulfobaculum xiamenense TaxID=995050 RepID=A0A846QVT3_9BACT|nr:glycosyltransferase family 2 protein [Desulfobaculum xiamenense]NJB68749.1 hypothetical protein [Desulfobaculum xiamenense]